jgi:hypothetical protein
MLRCHDIGLLRDILIQIKGQQASAYCPQWIMDRNFLRDSAPHISRSPTRGSVRAEAASPVMSYETILAPLVLHTNGNPVILST